jgi:exodeoxyribonuclease VII small subunit
MKEKMTLEEANVKLEELVKKMEDGELGIEESMKCYDEAFELLSYCYKQLDTYKGEIIDINKRIDEIKSKEDLFDE